MQRASITIILAGTELRLQYLSENMYALSELTGKNPISFLEAAIAGAKNAASVDELGPAKRLEIGGRVSDFGFIVPLIMAGLAHLDEFEDVSPRTLRKRICRLLDAEAEREKTAVMVVTAQLAARILPVYQRALSPPGKAVDADIATAAGKVVETGPLAEGSGLAGTG